MSYTDNPIADFHDWDDRQSKELAKLPVCCECDHPIQTEECYEINGELICPECLENNHKKRVDDYVC